MSPSPSRSLLIAAAVAAAVGREIATPPAPGLDVDARFRVEPVPPGDPREPKPGNFTVLGGVAYVRAADFEGVKARVLRARAKEKYGRKY